MAFYTPFQPPTDRDNAKVMRLVRLFRTFDTNLRDPNWQADHAASLARCDNPPSKVIQKGPHAGKVLRAKPRALSPFNLPVSNPHGKRWSEMTYAELKEARGWCMPEEQREALEIELQMFGTR